MNKIGNVLHSEKFHSVESVFVCFDIHRTIPRLQDNKFDSCYYIENWHLMVVGSSGSISSLGVVGPERPKY